MTASLGKRQKSDMCVCACVHGSSMQSRLSHAGSSMQSRLSHAGPSLKLRAQVAMKRSTGNLVKLGIVKDQPCSADLFETIARTKLIACTKLRVRFPIANYARVRHSGSAAW